MASRLRALRKIYRDELEIDWLVLGADAVGLLIVTLAFIHARHDPSAASATIEMASVALDVTR